MTTTIPAGMQTKFFKETQSSAPPDIVREGTTLYIPVFVRQEEADGAPLYRYFRVPVRYVGQDLNDYEKCVLQSYAEIRKFFYGDAAAQGEMRDDHQWEQHRQVIRSSFPKREGDTNPALARFEEIKDTFWETVDMVLESVEKTREDLPSYFNDTVMLEWAAENEVPADVIKSAKEAFMRVSSNLLMNDRNWIELFNA